MKTIVHRIELLVVDLENMGLEDVLYELDRSKYFTTTVLKAETRDAGEWDDDHPLNKRITDAAAYFESLPVIKGDL